MIVLFEIVVFILALYCLIYIPYFLIKKFINLLKDSGVTKALEQTENAMANPEQLSADQLIALWHTMNKGIQEERHKKLYQRVRESLCYLQNKTDSQEYEKVKASIISDFGPLIVNFSTLPKSLAYKKTNDNTAPVELFIENYELLTLQVEELTEQAFSGNIKDMRVQNKYMKSSVK